jgi:hypothetical protein
MSRAFSALPKASGVDLICGALSPILAVQVLINLTFYYVYVILEDFPM